LTGGQIASSGDFKKRLLAIEPGAFYTGNGTLAPGPTPVDLIKALYASGVNNGVCFVPVMALLIETASLDASSLSSACAGSPRISRAVATRMIGITARVMLMIRAWPRLVH
jgi:hypothetical protein